MRTIVQATGKKFCPDRRTIEIWHRLGNNRSNDVRGYIVEVDLLYPENIHDSTSSFPLCPENLDIYHEMLSPYQKRCLTNLHSREGYKSKKLTLETSNGVLQHSII